MFIGGASMKHLKLSCVTILYLLSLLSLGHAAVPKPEILDEEIMSSDENLARYDTLVIKDISSEDAEVQRKDSIENYSETIKAMSDSYYTSVSSKVKVSKGFKNVYRNDSTEPAAVVLETEFTTIDPGSRALRFWIGFVGEAALSVKGRVIDKQSGKVLIKFRQRRTSPLSWDNARDVLINNTNEIAEDVSTFLLKLKK
jgi:hypothetical protein